VARAVDACVTPIVSAVGHETDVSISDFVADVRAPPRRRRRTAGPGLSGLVRRSKACSGAWCCACATA
jgi:exodeoxyribonuclease VII large subunit